MTIPEKVALATDSTPEPSGGEYLYKCPFCRKAGIISRRPKLSIDYTRKLWHCWRCDAGGKLSALLKMLHIDYDEEDWLALPSYQPKNTSVQKDLALPEGFTIFSADMDVFGKLHYEYLVERGVTPEQMRKHFMGYTIKGKYAWRVIIPVINYGRLDYFVARATSDSMPDKYLNPPHPRRGVIFNLEGALTSATEEIIICEGVFSAIAVGDNAVATFGKKIHWKQLHKIVANAIARNLTLTIAFDGDAVDDAWKLADSIRSLGHQDIRLWIFRDGDDPADGKPIEIVEYNSSLVRLRHQLRKFL